MKRAYQRHQDDRPRLREFDDKRLFWLSLYQWARSHRVCIRCRRTAVNSRELTCGPCRERRKSQSEIALPSPRGL